MTESHVVRPCIAQTAVKPGSSQGRRIVLPRAWSRDMRSEACVLLLLRSGIPEAERKFLAGVSAQYECEVVYHSIREDLEKQGVIFLDMDAGLRQYPELVKEYFGTVIPAADNKFSALNSAVWSGGSFIYVPKNTHVEMPLQAYFRINAQNMGQFERTLIIADEGSRVHYVEGCTAPTYSSDSPQQRGPRSCSWRQTAARVRNRSWI
jgi:Fe-S cluster assembly scaffold protein SufB